MLPRRTPFALPFPDEVPTLAALLRGGSSSAPGPERLLEAASAHNVVGFVLEAGRLGRLRLSAGQMRSLSDGHLRRVAATALLRRELATVAAAVTTACKDRPVVIKGPALADRLYPDWRLRPYSDLDLMVPHDRLAAAVRALAAEGYAPLQELRPGYAERFGHDVHVRRGAGAGAVDVELHWRIGDDRVGEPLGHADLIRTAEPLAVGGAVVLVPSVADELLLASVHLLSDRARKLSWVNDIRLLAEAASTAEWETAFETADVAGGGLPWVLHRALDYAGHHLGLDRSRPSPAGPPPPFGPLRAVESLDLQASPHVGRLVALRGVDRLRYVRAIVVPTRAGLEGTVGGDGAGLPTLLARHAGRAVRGIMRPRR
jgi:hypothetical protein